MVYIHSGRLACREPDSFFSMAVRLFSDLRFEGSEVIRRGEATGDVILPRRPGSWDSFFNSDGKRMCLMSSRRITGTKPRRSASCSDGAPLHRGPYHQGNNPAVGPRLARATTARICVSEQRGSPAPHAHIH